jgi:hypothetical protein
MTAAQTTLRMEILREAKDRYDAITRAAHVSSNEYMLAQLKEMECEEMIRELMKDTGDA